MAVNDVPSEGGSTVERTGCHVDSRSLGGDTASGIHCNPARNVRKDDSKL
jgi:hypothetical protein